MKRPFSRQNRLNVAMKILLRKIFLVLLLLLSVTNVFAQEQLAIRKKIIPLHSTRSHVEKFARFVDNYGISVRYETDNEFLVVDYSKEKCVGHGWNIPADRVLSFDTYPKRDLLFETVQKRNKELFQMGSDTPTQHFINASEGIKYVVEGNDEKVEYISFNPTATDSNLRCEGFPKYNLISEHYVPFETFSIKNVSKWDVRHTYNILAKLKEDPEVKGYIFVYCKKGQTNKCKQLTTKIKKFAGNILKSEQLNRLMVTFGGYRYENEIETFLLPKDFPPATARPYFSSKF